MEIQWIYFNGFILRKMARFNGLNSMDKNPLILMDLF